MSTDTTIDTEALGNSVEQGVDNLFRDGWGGALETILFAALLLVVCLVAKAILLKILDRALNKLTHVERSLHTFIRSMANILLWFVTLMVVAESLGINANSLLALVGVLGLAVSLAVKDSLANLASGLTILSTKPFKVGDYVEIGDIEGTVQDIGLVYTSLNTLDNRRILVPNSNVVDEEVINYTTEPLRREGHRRLRRPGGGGQGGHPGRHRPPREDPGRPRPLRPAVWLWGQRLGIHRPGLVPEPGLLDGLP